MISWAWPASMDAALDSLLVALFLALPVAGLVAGPIYAPAVFGVAVLRLGWLTAYHRTRLSLDRKLVLLAIFFCRLEFCGPRLVGRPRPHRRRRPANHLCAAGRPVIRGH